MFSSSVSMAKSLFAVSESARTITRDSLDGTLIKSFTPTGVGRLEDIVVHNGIIYVADHDSSLVRSYQMDGTPLSTFGNGLASPHQLAFDASGTLFVASDGTGRIEKYSASGTHLGTFATGTDLDTAISQNQATNTAHLCPPA